MNGLGKDAAQIISRINGFTYVQTEFDYFNGEGTDKALKVVKEVPYGSNPDRLIVKCYGFTDTLGRMHSDAQFEGSSSVPAHVEMMGFMGMGNNPMVGCTVACAVAGSF